MRKTRIRYSRDANRIPKNTLVTIRKDDIVYFGIARCNVKSDTFAKYIGSNIASDRAELAQEDESTDALYVVDDKDSRDIRLHKSKLRGSAHIDNIRGLIDYFNNIDEFALGGR